MPIRRTKIRHAIGAASILAQDFPSRSTREARWQRLPQVFFLLRVGWVFTLPVFDGKIHAEASCENNTEQDQAGRVPTTDGLVQKRVLETLEG